MSQFEFSSFAIIWYYISFVSSQVKFLSWTNHVFLVLSQFEILSFVTIWVFEFCHIFIFQVLSQFKFLSLGKIRFFLVLSQFEFESFIHKYFDIKKKKKSFKFCYDNMMCYIKEVLIIISFHYHFFHPKFSYKLVFIAHFLSQISIYRKNVVTTKKIFTNVSSQSICHHTKYFITKKISFNFLSSFK